MNSCDLKWTELVGCPKSGLHCKEILIYVFPEKELRGLSPSYHIYVSVNDLYVYIPTIGPPIFLQQNKQTDGGKI
jgi:hypothetical protein